MQKEKEGKKLAFQIPKQPYSGKIGTTTIGTGSRSVTLGGSEAYPFYLFEGKMPNPPRIAMEIWDMAPEDWAEAALAPFKDVVNDPAAWAKKCVNEFCAEMIVLQLKSIDPNGMDRSAAEAAQVALKVLKAVDVPVVFWGTANNQKDEEVLKKISESSQGKNVVVHCSAGLGRTGLLLACLAKQTLGLDGEAAIQWVRQYIPGAVETDAQRQFVNAF